MPNPWVSPYPGAAPNPGGTVNRGLPKRDHEASALAVPPLPPFPRRSGLFAFFM